MNHSYEEIRAAVLDILAGREKNLPYEQNQYGHLSIGVAEVFARREKPPGEVRGSRAALHLGGADSDLFLEVFWDLFRR
jgi:hypothetical protein